MIKLRSPCIPDLKPFYYYYFSSLILLSSGRGRFCCAGAPRHQIVWLDRTEVLLLKPEATAAAVWLSFFSRASAS